MNPDALNRWLAEHVLGWRQLPYTMGYGFYPPGPPESNALGHTVPNFYHSFADCDPLLEQIEKDGWEWIWAVVRCIDGTLKYRCDMTKTIRLHAIEETADTRTAALCLAVAKAYGWKEPHEEA